MSPATIAHASRVGRIWALLAGDSAPVVDFETFGKFILEAPTHAALQVPCVLYACDAYVLRIGCTPACAPFNLRYLCVLQGLRSGSAVDVILYKLAQELSRHALHTNPSPSP